MSNLKQLFLGQYGLRAGWRLLVYLILVEVFGRTLFATLPQGNSSGTTLSQVLRVTIVRWAFAFSVLIPAIIMMRIEKRQWGSYGLPLTMLLGRSFWRGAVWGLLGLTAVIFSIRALHGFQFGSLALGQRQLVAYGLIWALAALGTSTAEEFFFRGYVQATLASGIGFWPSAVVLSGIFGLVHLFNAGESALGAIAAGLFGLFLSFTLKKTGNLWFAVGMHSFFNWGEDFLYSVPDSGRVLEPGHLLNSQFHGPHWLTGGNSGPEASVFMFILIAFLFTLFVTLNARFDRAESHRASYSGA